MSKSSTSLADVPDTAGSGGRLSDGGGPEMTDYASTGNPVPPAATFYGASFPITLSGTGGSGRPSPAEPGAWVLVVGARQRHRRADHGIDLISGVLAVSDLCCVWV